MEGLTEKLEMLGEYICDHVCERVKKGENACETCRLEECIKGIEETEFRKKKIKCDICGFEFEPKKENHYVITTANVVGSRDLDCFDCPNCGCQAKTKERIGIKENQKTKADENNNKRQRKGWWK